MFITFEGIDGSGKSTQIKNLVQKLRQTGAEVQTFRDPGGPEVSERVRDLLLSPDFEIDPVTELLLFSSARSQLVAECVLPNLEQGSVVILDRFYDSTTAYQGYGRKSVSLNEIQKLNNIASHGRKPDITIYMKLSLAEAKERLPEKKDRMEQAGDSFFGKVIEGFNKLAEAEDRFFTVDATEPAERVHKEIWKHVQAHL
ncbi:thymidylate kinase [Fodinibius salinus]|uniref:Thymidylate kinase n=1 Tax=Fodinibius salinus TaxID=860790 RepID=A0A5D3YN14_9BACT|nr:dTMP kinase [Fodinibius salinus]TYP95092.1 thymidylate kinase [Fodinibius salinus]